MLVWKLLTSFESGIKQSEVLQDLRDGLSIPVDPHLHEKSTNNNEQQILET